MKNQIFSYQVIVLLCLVVTMACKPSGSDQTVAAFKNIDVSQAKAIMEKDASVKILDVRTPEETAAGTIPDAITLDFYADDFKENVAKLERSEKYIVYCGIGKRSLSASEIMKDLGFKDVSNLLGGYNAWSEENK